MSSRRLRIEGRRFRDRSGREVTLRGINCAADAKFPSHPVVTSHDSVHFFDGDTVSFRGRPFSSDDAHDHFTRLKRFGFNTIRYIFTWEAIEHAGPGKYDEEWIDHTIQILRTAKEYGFYIFMDPHQDVWSRFTGGSGSPMWTLYAAGLNPEKFQVTEAAIPQNTWPDGPENFPKMIWATNYYRLACFVMFTAFFGGKQFLPKAIIDGKNIQDYLQDHYFGALRHLAKRIREAGDLEGEVVIGWESWNEPNKGLLGRDDLSIIPATQSLKNGTSPTPFQSMLLASGRSCEVETYAVGSFGPYKTGTQLVDPEGESAWLPADYDDTKYGWKRDPGWKLGECIWAQHGLWDPSTDTLLKKDYFAKVPNTQTVFNDDYYMNHNFVEHWRKYRQAIKTEAPEAIMFCQPSPFEIPPEIKGTQDDTNDLVYAPHFYDGITLMTKRWNRFWNIDVLGILRGRYLSPAFAVKVGETAIRNCFKDQLASMVQEGIDYMGEHPCIFTEIGIPFDMDDRNAYKTGDYTSQALAMDANMYGIEGAGCNGLTVWVYTATNNHQWGDQWNGEDLSIYSTDDKPLPLSPFKETHSGSHTLGAAIDPSNIDRTLSTPSIKSAPSITDPDIATGGYRAAEASVRPSPIHTCGTLKGHGFDLRNCVFTLTLDCPSKVAPAASSDGHYTDDAVPDSTAQRNEPTEIFLPEFHFPADTSTIEVSSGRYEVKIDHADHGLGLVQRLRWWHGAGEQSISVTGIKRRVGAAIGKEEEEEGYLEQCRRSACMVM